MKSKKEKRAEKIYNDLLKQVEKTQLGTGITYSSDLDRLMKSILGKKFAGVKPRNQIPKLDNFKKYCIVNLDANYEPGSHWVALIKNKDHYILYDSFGRNHSTLLPNLKKLKKGRIFNDLKDSEQGILEQNCGQRCVAIILLDQFFGSDLVKLV